MNKKAVFLELPLDTYGWVITFLGILFWLAVFTISEPGITYNIEEPSINLRDDSVLLTILRSPVDTNTNIADMITDVYLKKGDPVKLQNELNLILNSVFGQAKPVCWKLWYYDKPGSEESKTLLSEECTGESENLFDARTIIPVSNNKLIEVRLIVPGYKK